MWGWDLSQEEAPIEPSSPQLLPHDAATSSPSTVAPQPVIVPNVETLKEQFQQQESMLAHIRETLRENDADLSTKEKQLEMYANKLSQIKSRSKGQKKVVDDGKLAVRRSSKDKKDDQVDGGNKITPKGKMSELKKQLEVNKKQFEERTEKGITEAKKIESMVEQLRTQVLERDVTIHELQKSIDTPTPPRPKVQTLPRRHKEKPVVISKWTQTFLLDEGEGKIKELEAMVVDLQDTLKQQASVIAARTKAVALLSEDLSKKGKTAVDELEDTRREMREMQAKFVAVETEFKTSLVEKDNRLLDLEEKLQTLQRENAQLLEKNAAVEAELESKSRESHPSNESKDVTQVLDLERKVEELTKELDDSNKLMIRLKLEHKNKLKAANKSLEKLKQGSEEKPESLSAKVDELVGQKEKLQAKITELEEEKATFLERSNAWQSDIQVKEAEIADLQMQLTVVTEDKQTLMQTIEDQNILIDNLHARIKEPSNPEVFEIPGDAASRQFDVSNEHVQTEIEGLVKEKQELLERLKNLSSFENIGIEPEITSKTQSPVAAQADKDTYEQELAKEKCRSAELEAKLSSLERVSEKPGSKAVNTLKNKLKKLENEVMKGKAVIDELHQALAVKDQIIEEMNGKLLSDHVDSAWESGALEDMQKKCLTLESSLFQISEQCEHLRKENIEVVHQLSGEKVRRIRAEEEAEAVRILLIAAQELDLRVQALEAAEPSGMDAEYANIVIAGKDTEIFNIQSSLADKAQVLDRITEELNQIKNENNDLRNAIPQRDYEIQLLNNNLQQAQMHISGLEKTIEQLKGQVNEERNRSEATDNLSTQVDAKTRECEALRLECQKLEAALDVAMMELSVERTKLEENTKNGTRYIEEIMKERDEVLIKIEESEKVLQKTWKERNELIQSQERSYKQIMEMERQLSELTANFRELSLVHAGCQTDNLKQELAGKLQELESVKNELAVKQQNMESLTVKAKKLAANLKKKAQVEKETQELVDSLKHEGEILAKQLNANEEIIAEKNLRIKELLDERTNLDHSNVNSETAALTEEISRLGAVVQGLVAENAEYHKRNQFLQQQIKEKDELLSEAKTHFSGNVEKLESMVSENNLLKDKLSQFEETLVLEKNEKDAINELYKKTSGELRALETAFELEERENEMLLNQKTDMLKKIDSYAADIEKLQQENQNLVQKIDNLQHLEGDYKVLMDEKAVIERELFNKNELIIAYEERINDLLQSSGDYHDLKSKLQAENEKINREKDDIVEQLHQFEVKHNLLLEEKTFLENERNQLIASVETRLADSQEIINKLEIDNRTLQDKLRANEEQHATDTAQMEKQISNFNIAFDAEVQKNATLKGELEALKVQLQDFESASLPEKPERKKKKSVTFNTEGADYIKELRGEVASLQKALVESDATVGELKAALGDKPDASETFAVGLFDAPPAGDFFDQFPSQEPNDPFVEDSLQWDDSWGTEGQLEAEHAISKATEENSEKITKLESELKNLYSEKESVQEELRVLQVKYAKLIKKLKEQKSIIDRLQGEAKKSSGFGDLEATMVDEMRAEMVKAEKRESDLRKELDGLQNEHEGLLKKIEVLNLGNEKYLELKERQTSDAALWQNQQAELRAEIADLKSQLLAAPGDDSTLTQENRELKNLIEGLEWKVSELTEMIDEKEEELTRLSHQASPAEKFICNTCQESSDKLVDVQQQLETLITENEDLHEFIKNERTQAKSVPEPAPTLSQFFPMEQWQPVAVESPFDAIARPVEAATPSEDVKPLKDLLNIRDQEITKARSLEAEQINLMHLKDSEIEILRSNLENMQRAYSESKAEIERLLREDQLRIDNPTEEELAQMRQVFELEKSRLESIIKARDLELKSLQDTLGSTERDWDETQGHNDDVIQQLKSQLRELDATAAHTIEDKDYELQELRARCDELKDLCKSLEDAMEELRQDRASALKESECIGEKIRNEYESRLAASNEALLEKTDELYRVRAEMERQDAEIMALRKISDELNILQKRLAAKEADFTNLLQQSSSVEAEFLTRDAEARELRAELLTKDAELRELRSDMQGLRDEVSQFQNFDKQLLAIRTTQGEGSQAVAPGWNMQDMDDLCARLQSDLDATLYHLHQRDVRCSELTLELTQLLEERDVLQLRLSTVIRQNEELRVAVNASSSTSEPTANMRNLADKISELHTVGYKRDKSFQDESQQRHREQMALLGREARSKNTKPVFDI